MRPECINSLQRKYVDPAVLRTPLQFYFVAEPGEYFSQENFELTPIKLLKKLRLASESPSRVPSNTKAARPARREGGARD